MATPDTSVLANGKVRLGAVCYTDGNGYDKLALVVGTRKSTQKDTAVQRPEKGHANLLVFSPANPEKTYVRWNVPAGTGPRTFRAVKGSAVESQLADAIA